MGLFNVKNSQIDITNIDHVKHILQEVQGFSNLQRKREAYKLFEVIEGKQLKYTKEKLKSVYPTTYSKFRLSDISIAKKIINKKNKAYQRQPKRKLKNEKASKILSEIYNDSEFSRAFKEADKIFNAHKYVAMWLTYVNPKDDSQDLKGEYVLQALAPYEYDIVRHEVTGEPLIFILSYSGTDVTGGNDGIEQAISESQADTKAQTKQYLIWTNDFFADVVTQGIDANSKPNLKKFDLQTNDIGIIPVTFLSKDLSVDYPIRSNVAEQSIDWNISFSDLKTAASAQGHGQLVVSHVEGKKLKNLHMGQHTAITLPQSKKPDMPKTTAEYINANPDLSGQLDVLKFDLVNILDDNGITSKNNLIGGADAITSGFDRLLKEADVGDIIEDNQSLYANKLELGVFKQLSFYENYLNNPLFLADTLQVYFEKPKVLISDKETLDNIKQREELGLLLAWEKHIILNPNLTEKQAKEREALIQEEKQAAIAEVQNAFDKNNPNNDPNLDPNKMDNQKNIDPKNKIDPKKDVKK